MKLIPVIILSILLSGCSILDYFRDRPQPPQIPPAKVLVIDSSLLTFCSLLEEKPNITTFQSSLEAYASLASKYGECALKQASGVKLIKKLGNIE